MKITIPSFIGILFLLPQSAAAVLIDNGNYFTDTNTGLDWLNLTETVSRSYNDVYSNLGSGGDFQGW